MVPTVERPRIDLAAAIPLAAPMALFLEPTNVCNFRCGFCPESLPDFKALSDTRRPAGFYGEMSHETFERVRSDLARWPRLKVIRYYMLGEPLLNRRLPEMIRALEGFTERSVVTTNGSLLGRSAGELCWSGVDEIRVSIYGVRDGDYQQNTGSRFSVETIRENLKTFLEVRSLMATARWAGPKLTCELIMEDPAAADVIAFREQFRGLADLLEVNDGLHNWGGGLVNIGVPALERAVCPMPFYYLSIRASGLVTVCCADYSNSLRVGDIHDESLQDIWNGRALAWVQNMHLAGRRGEITACKGCTAFRKYPDNLDSRLGSQIVPPAG